MISFRTPVLHGLRGTSCTFDTRKPYFDCTGARLRAVLEFGSAAVMSNMVLFTFKEIMRSRNAIMSNMVSFRFKGMLHQGNTAVQWCYHVQHGTVHVEGILRWVLPCPTCSAPASTKSILKESGFTTEKQLRHSRSQSAQGLLSKASGISKAM